MKLAIGQINPKVGDLSGNLARIQAMVAQANKTHADLLVFPELALLGYPPRDLLLRQGFVEATDEAFQEVVKESTKIPIVIGHIAKASPGPKNKAGFLWHPYPLHNAVFLLSGGTILGYQAKLRLPSFDVFEEERYFSPAENIRIFELLGLRVGLSLGEDFWYTEKTAQLDLLINIAASPYFRGKPTLRFSQGRDLAKRANVPLVYANLVGGQDELIFDGRSFAVRPDGLFLLAAPAFSEGVFTVDLGGQPAQEPNEIELEDIHRALVLGIRDYCQKNGIARAVIGISGGVDSALVTALAVEALGKENVLGAFLPSAYTAEISKVGAQALAENLGIKLVEIPITPVFEILKETLASTVSVAGVVAENLQARIRAVILMALANANSALVLCPANKAEIAVGYNTLYGDTAGALAPVGDLLKDDIYALARHINEEAGKPVIPEEILRRPPSAELRPNQKDEDDLPPYSLLNPYLRALIEENAAKTELEERFGKEVSKEILRRFYRAEFKRRQLPLILKITKKAFGMGWRFPVTHGFSG